MIDSAAAAYAAIEALQEPIRLYRDLPHAELRALQAGATAARKWLAEHPREDVQFRLETRYRMCALAVMDLQNETDTSRRIDLATVLYEAADDLTGAARELAALEQDKAAADRARRLREEHDARRLPRRAEDIAARIAS